MTDSAREQQEAAFRASQTDGGLTAWLRNLGVSAAAGVFMALIGALGTDAISLPLRLAYWLPLMIGGGVIAHFFALVVVRIPRVGASPWMFGALLALAIALPITVIVWAYSNFMFGGDYSWRGVPDTFVPVLVICAAMTGIMMIASRPGRVTHAAPSDAAAQPVRFMERLPAKLRGAAIYAVSSEDHYLRLHTSKGADLILMRLSDAISELEGLEGAQTHRSWWVARDAVENARREGDKVILELKGGVEAPVSRPNVRPLREAGWY